MITRLIEISVFFNNKKINIINTQMEILIDWDIEINKKEDSATIKYIYKSVSGNFTIEEQSELYKKSTTYKICIDGTWEISTIPIFDGSNSENISPTSCIINFDNKSAKIKF